MALHTACTSLFSPSPFGFDLGRIKILLLEMVSSVYLSCLNMSVVCHSSKKQITEMLLVL